jgi:hypothetical protein
MIFTQKYVADMCEAIGAMKLTESKREFAKAVMRAAIEYANAKNHMHASPEAKAAAQSSGIRNSKGELA